MTMEGGCHGLLLFNFYSYCTDCGEKLQVSQKTCAFYIAGVRLNPGAFPKVSVLELIKISPWHAGWPLPVTPSDTKVDASTHLIQYKIASNTYPYFHPIELHNSLLNN